MQKFMQNFMGIDNRQWLLPVAQLEAGVLPKWQCRINSNILRRFHWQVLTAV